jgi:hypothetical protein
MALKKRISERKVILYTAALVLFSGLIRVFAYSFGVYLFYLSFFPFLFYRFYTIFFHRAKGFSQQPASLYRIFVLISMVITIVLNIVGWQEADFFLLFLLMVDYLLVINKRF